MKSGFQEFKTINTSDYERLVFGNSELFEVLSENRLNKFVEDLFNERFGESNCRKQFCENIALNVMRGVVSALRQSGWAENHHSFEMVGKFKLLVDLNKKPDVEEVMPTMRWVSEGTEDA